MSLLPNGQKTVLNRFLDGFEGKLTAKKWAVRLASVQFLRHSVTSMNWLSAVSFVRNPGGQQEHKL